MSLTDLAHELAGEWGIVPSMAHVQIERLVQRCAETPAIYEGILRAVADCRLRLAKEDATEIEP